MNAAPKLGRPVVYPPGSTRPGKVKLWNISINSELEKELDDLVTELEAKIGFRPSRPQVLRLLINAYRAAQKE